MKLPPARANEPGIKDEAAGGNKVSAAEDRDDAALLARLAATEDDVARQEAWEKIVGRQRGALLSFARMMTSDEATAEDAVQEAFIELWRAVTVKKTEIENAKGWLFRLVGRKAMQNLKRRRRRRETTLDAVQPETAGKAAVEGGREEERRELQERLHGLVEKLPGKLRLPVMLHFGSGLTQMEIAETMGCRQSTVSARLNEALTRLRRGLDHAGYRGVPVAFPVLLGEVLTSLPPAPGGAAIVGGGEIGNVKTVGSEASRRAAAGAGVKGTAVAAKIVAGIAALAGLAAAAVWLEPAGSKNPSARSPVNSSTAGGELRAAAAKAPPPWRPLDNDRFTVPDVNKTGSWKAEKTPAGLRLTFTPKGKAPQELRSFCYLGHKNFTSSFELQGTVKYLGREKKFYFEPLVCLPNRFNSRGYKWTIPVEAAPIKFIIQAWMNDKGCRMTARLKDAAGTIYTVRGKDEWLPPPWTRKHEAGNYLWSRFAGMKECGFGFAAADAVCIENLQIRPLVRGALLPEYARTNSEAAADKAP